MSLKQATLPSLIAECSPPVSPQAPLREDWYLVLYLTHQGYWTILGTPSAARFLTAEAAEREAQRLQRTTQVVRIPGGWWPPRSGRIDGERNPRGGSDAD